MIVHGAKTGKEALHVVPRSLFEAEVCLRDFERIPDSRKSPARKHIAALPQTAPQGFLQSIGQRVGSLRTQAFDIIR